MRIAPRHLSARSSSQPLRWVGALAVVLSLGACGGPGDEASRTAPAVSPAPTPAPTGGTGLTAPASSDASVLGALVAIDQNMIDLSQDAIARHVGGGTEDFAREMAQAYQADLEKARTLGAGGGAQAQALRARGQGALHGISQEDEENPYRNAFLAAITLEHANALKLLDAELIPGAKSDEVRAYLSGARKSIAERYERAQAESSTR